jgi:hypothetical protein
MANDAKHIHNVYASDDELLRTLQNISDAAVISNDVTDSLGLDRLSAEYVHSMFILTIGWQMCNSDYSQHTFLKLTLAPLINRRPLGITLLLPVH